MPLRKMLHRDVTTTINSNEACKLGIKKANS